MINPKQKLSGAIVFASVFVGSFMGAAVTLVTAPKSVVEGLHDKFKDTVEVLEENVSEHADAATIMLIENATKVFARAKINIAKAVSIVGSIKDTFLPMLKK
jgi:gas vesicle protein